MIAPDILDCQYSAHFQMIDGKRQCLLIAGHCLSSLFVGQGGTAGFTGDGLRMTPHIPSRIVLFFAVLAHQKPLHGNR